MIMVVKDGLLISPNNMIITVGCHGAFATGSNEEYF